MTALSVRARLAVSVSLGFGAACVSVVNAMSPRHRDFTVVWEAARALLSHRDAYTTLYPLPAIVAATPFAPLPSAPVACGVFMLLGGTAFAWALSANGRGALLGFFAAGVFVTAVWVQWTPLHAGAYALAPLGVFLVVKPHSGAAIFCARPSWWPIVMGLLCLAVAYSVDPQWFAAWRANMALSGAELGVTTTGLPYTAPALLPGGVLVLLALTRWRRPEARLLVGLACVPQSLLLYETVPLALVPRGWKESALFVALTWLVYWRLPSPVPSFPRFAMASGLLSTACIYLPLTVMVLRRPNTGAVPAWLERRIAAWPAWIRGHA